ncbi:MAG: chorismate-binding protein [Acidobacteriota bacterium]
MHDAFDIPADLDTPVSAYLKLAPLSPRFLLESVEGGERLGRYSFIGFGEGRELVIGADAERVDGPALLDRLRRELEAAPTPAPARGLPLPGGLVGAAGFDLIRRFERLPSRATARTDEPEALFFSPRTVLVFDHLSRRAALLHDGTDGEREGLEREVRRALAGSLPPRETTLTHATPVPSLQRSEYLDAVREVQQAIGRGDVYQLVLAIRFAAACHGDPFQVYRALRLLNPSPYMYFLDIAGTQIVGSSPEALVKLSGREASLRPIAGTRRRGRDEDDDLVLERELLADPKEAAEHVMLVDLARNDLGRVATAGSVEVHPSRAIERYSHVMHLVSGVRGVLAPGYDAFDLFAAAFPAGTVSGAPKIRAMELIDQLEPVRRGFYAGTVGYFAHGGAMDQAIAIRTLVFRNGEVSFQAGAGIVSDSVPESEHDEVIAKSAALLSALTRAGEGL